MSANLNNVNLLEAVAVTAEMCGAVMSEGVTRRFVEHLQQYPAQAVMKALALCETEIKHRLTLADVIERIEDGRPGPEEAWTTCPHSEQSSAVWTQEAQGAFFAGACDLLEQGDSIGARMAFKEAYQRLVNEAKVAQKPVKWVISLGWDVHDRQVKLAEAVSLGRLSLDVAVLKFPQLEYKPAQLKLVSHA